LQKADLDISHHQWPAIPGLHDFKGQITHSARWDHNYDYSNKRIAVIGNGSSGIQIVPQMAKLPGTDVTNFIRGPTWVVYRVSPSVHLGRPSEEVNPSYLESEKKLFAEHPTAMRDHRRAIIGRTTKAFRMFIKGSDSNIEGQRFAVKQMSEKLGHDPVLCSKLIPKWDLGCRRVTPGPGYLESFTLPNCHLTDSGIVKISEKGLHTADGRFHEVDVGQSTPYPKKTPFANVSKLCVQLDSTSHIVLDILL
jgi:cation diffusion facilitator CzcD-associated flavoprotein CzcO